MPKKENKILGVMHIKEYIGKVYYARCTKNVFFLVHGKR